MISTEVSSLAAHNIWLNDCLLHAKTEDDLLATLNFILKQCQKYGLKLHARKCVLFLTTVRYCGPFIAKDGVRTTQTIWKHSRQYASRQWCRLGTVCRGSKLDAKRDTQLLEACGPSSSSIGESVRGYKPQDEECCSRSVAATPLSTRGLSGFQRLASSYHGVNDFGFPRPKQKDPCLDRFLRSFLCCFGDTKTRGAAGSSNGRARPPAS
jgi:hypothetical protein